MKNLKKVLSLVLALAMALSLMTVAFAKGASDFADYDKVSYKEAVDVMVAAGVFNGADGNNFNANGDLTREQAAKIVTYMLVGQERADKLVATAAPYADVAKDRWSAGAIAYCTEQGILAGSNGKFDPTGKLTGLAFAKMLLVALGYDAQIEGLVGSSWAINTANLALGDADLDKGMESIALSAILNREQAAQMAFNAFKAELVRYESKGTNIKLPDGTSVVVGATPATTYGNDAKVQNNLNDSANLAQFAEKYCEKLALTNATDAFERPTNKWTYDKVKVGSYAKTADLTYTKEVKLGDIYKDLGLSDTIAADKVTFHVDGAAEAAPMNAYTLSKGDSTKIGGNGVLTEVFYSKSAGTAEVTLTNTYAGEVSSVRAATASKDANITVTPLNAGRGGNYDTAKFAVDDVVLYNYSAKSSDTGVKNVVKAERVTGTLTGYTAGKTVTVDGKTYDLNSVATVETSTLAGALKNNVTLTLDAYGYVLDVDAKATSTNYAVVLKYKDKDNWDDAKAQLLFTDGTTKDVKLTADVDKKDASSGTDVESGAIVSYTVNNKDKYTLTVLNNPTAVNGSTSGVAVTTKGSSTLASINSVTTANGKTVFLVKTKSGDDTTYTAYTGIANVPTIKVAANQNISANAYVKSGTAATVVYIDATTHANVESSTKNVVFVLGDSTVGQSYDSVRGTFYRYDAIVNGEITKIDSLNQITSKGMYTTIAKDSHDVVTLSGNDGVTAGTGTDKEANGAIGLNGSYYSYAKDCQVFYIDADGNISTSSVSGIAKDETDEVWFKVTDGDVTTIVISDAVSSSTKITTAKAVGKKGDTSSRLTVTEAAAVDTSAKTVKVTASNPSAKDTITVTLTADKGASLSTGSVTLTYKTNGWDTAKVTVTAENGTTAEYTVSVA